jgi:general secretion pathway protein B
MSYILDALRKSEQQRQAIEPDTVTERLLANPSQPKQKPTKWIIALVFSNLLVVAYFAWFFAQKKVIQQQLPDKVVDYQEKQPLPTAQGKPQLEEIGAQGKIAKAPDQPMAAQLEQQNASPSIAQLYQEKKEAIKKAEAQRSAKDIPAQKPIVVKKEPLTPKQKAPGIQAVPPHALAEKPENLPTKKGIPELNDLPYEIRNNLPNLTINVFSYAHQPEDRFVIIDMVKYKTGQLIKDSVKLMEIRPDSILLHYGDETFRVDRP